MIELNFLQGSSPRAKLRAFLKKSQRQPLMVCGIPEGKKKKNIKKR
jgi:hypothetical protein